MFTGTFRCINSVGAIEQPGQPQEGQRHMVSFKPMPNDEDNVKLWDGTPDAVIQLGKLPPGIAYDFKLGQTYKVTIEPI